MPKAPHRNNPKLVKPARNETIRAGSPRKINDLLSRSGLGTAAVQAYVEGEHRWAEFFAAKLEPALCRAVAHYVEHGDTLTIFVRSAAWAARWRYALPTLDTEAEAFRPVIKKRVVKIQPAAASTGART